MMPGLDRILAEIGEEGILEQHGQHIDPEDEQVIQGPHFHLTKSGRALVLWFAYCCFDLLKGK